MTDKEKLEWIGENVRQIMRSHGQYEIHYEDDYALMPYTNEPTFEKALAMAIKYRNRREYAQRRTGRGRQLNLVKDP